MRSAARGTGCHSGREALAPTPRSNRASLPVPDLVWTGGSERLEGARLLSALE